MERRERRRRRKRQLVDAEQQLEWLESDTHSKPPNGGSSRGGDRGTPKQAAEFTSKVLSTTCYYNCFCVPIEISADNY